MGRTKERDRHAQRALALVDRLTPRERYYIEGYYYSSKIETIGRAIAAYEKVLSLYPDHSASRNNLSTLYMRTDQYEKAIEQHEILRQRGFEFPGSAGNLAEAYVAANRGDKALKVMREFVGRFPAVESGHMLEGGIAMSLNRLDEAEAGVQEERWRCARRFHRRAALSG